MQHDDTEEAPAMEATSAPVSPGARKLAEAHGLNLATIAGSGPGGRVVKSDVQALVAGAAPVEAAVDADGRGTVRRIELERAQRAVVRRMTAAKSEIPEFTIETEVDMGACLALREQFKPDTTGPAPSVNDMIVRSAALALRDVPAANGAYVDGHIELYSRVNIGIAVAAPGVLVVPTIFDADVKPLEEIARATRAAAEQVRTGRVTPAELAGGTFTVSNLGMFGVTRFTAVINAPQAAILAAGAIVRRMRSGDDGGAELRPVMSLTLTCDHRVLYGADAAALISRLREHLEAPSR
jgi:pyruvate dehydrogenase E2 component (dihydrolipoamide acetyltransferase)